MAAVSEVIVREFFELNGFFVRQQRKYIAPTRLDDDEIDFLIWNSRYQAEAAPPPFVMATQDLSGISRAVVVVKGWHTETFSPGVLANAPEIFRFVEPPVFQQVRSFFFHSRTVYLQKSGHRPARRAWCRAEDSPGRPAPR